NEDAGTAHGRQRRPIGVALGDDVDEFHVAAGQLGQPCGHETGLRACQTGSSGSQPDRPAHDSPPAIFSASNAVCGIASNACLSRSASSSAGTCSGLGASATSKSNKALSASAYSPPPGWPASSLTRTVGVWTS